MMDQYTINNEEDRRNGLHEVMQQITLAGLHRAEFFKNAAFYGGTCLRIFHNLPRFSEDMDFSLLSHDPNFTLIPYFDAVKNEFHSLGRDVTITRKEKAKQTNVESAFLKDNTEIYSLKFNSEKKIKIKIEVDVNPPLGFETEQKLLLQPYSFMTRCFTLPNLFAGKMHALIFRKWQGRVKGRDWFDFEWYVKKNIPLNLAHFLARAQQFSSLEVENFTPEDFKKLLNDKITNTNIDQVIADVKPFVKNQQDLNIWSTDYFIQLVDFLKFE
ncbi:MAG TPA: hypothetical protein DCQ50_08300 [Chryseobacterium sp.]|nr:hypothetical protein [Chryseobacterium sp.]